MSQTLAVDYSFSRPAPSVIAHNGYVAVGRYLGGSASKDLTRGEAAALHTAGLGIWLVWEGVASRAKDGYGAGQADARAAQAAAAALGYPSECPLFFAVDFDAQPGDVRPYFQGVKSVVGARAGVYGGIRVTEGLRDLIPYRWQTVAWSGGQVDPEAHLYQRAAMKRPIAGCDENVICHPFPMWGGSSPKPKPPAKPKSRGPNIDVALAALYRARDANPRTAHPIKRPRIDRAIKALEEIKAK